MIDTSFEGDGDLLSETPVPESMVRPRPSETPGSLETPVPVEELEPATPDLVADEILSALNEAVGESRETMTLYEEKMVAYVDNIQNIAIGIIIVCGMIAGISAVNIISRFFR